MNLYLFKREDSKVDWDEYEGFVVRAPNESHARVIIGYQYEDEYEVMVIARGVTGEPKIILGAFKSG